MAEIIRPPKKTPKVIVHEETLPVAPDLSLLQQQRFQREAVTVLEDRLLKLGLIIPRDRIKLLSPALTEIGKFYYSLVSSKALF